MEPDSGHWPAPRPPQAGPVVHTIGHSNHPIARFLDLLCAAGVDCVVDVRSRPYSRFVPHFNKRALSAALADAGLGYVFLGEALGARPADPSCYVDGRVSYARIARRPEFGAGLEHVSELARGGHPVLMCAEREPLDCHRNLLVARALAGRGVAIRHIQFDGGIEDNADTEARLLAAAQGTTLALFGDGGADPLAEAYAARVEHRTGRPQRRPTRRSPGPRPGG